MLLSLSVKFSLVSAVEENKVFTISEILMFHLISSEIFTLNPFAFDTISIGLPLTSMGENNRLGREKVIHISLHLDSSN